MEGLTIAANDLEDVASQSGLDGIAAVKPQLAQVRLEINQAENRLLADSLARNLTSDDFLIDSEVRKRLLDRLRPRWATALICRWLDCCELKRSWRSMISVTKNTLPKRSMSCASKSPDCATRANRRPRSGWRTPGFCSPAWRSTCSARLARTRPSRRSMCSPPGPKGKRPIGTRAAERSRRSTCSSGLGDAALPLSEKDAVRFHDLPRDWTAQAATAVTYLEKAQRLGDSSPDVAGLLALAMSVSAQQADTTETWTKIAQYADRRWQAGAA